MAKNRAAELATERAAKEQWRQDYSSLAIDLDNERAAREALLAEVERLRGLCAENFQGMQEARRANGEIVEELRTAEAKLKSAEAQLQIAEQKLAKLDKLIQLAQQTDAGKSDAEIAASSEFSEAIAYGQCQLLEDELAATQAKLQIAREALEKIALPKEYEGIRGWDATEEAATAHAALAQITKP